MLTKNVFMLLYVINSAVLLLLNSDILKNPIDVLRLVFYITTVIIPVIYYIFMIFYKNEIYKELDFYPMDIFAIIIHSVSYTMLFADILDIRGITIFDTVYIAAPIIFFIIISIPYLICKKDTDDNQS